MKPRSEPETKEARIRRLEERIMRDFLTVLNSIERRKG